MSNLGLSDNPSVLIVAQADDPPIRDAVAALNEPRETVRVVPDVYAAMAQLSLSPNIRHVLVDVRRLDQHERAFLQLAPRYFRDAEFCIADLPGAASRLRLDESPAPLKSVGAFIALVTSVTPAGDAPLEAPDAAFHMPHSAVAETQPTPSAQGPLSTDPEQLADDPSPSLHEAVRRRMAGDDAGTFQRKPPVRTPPRPAPTVTPQELDALLAPHETVNPESQPGDANTGRPR